jgi:hypothetical protein
VSPEFSEHKSWARADNHPDRAKKNTKLLVREGGWELKTKKEVSKNFGAVLCVGKYTE